MKSLARRLNVAVNSLMTAALALPSTAGACTSIVNLGGLPAVPPTLSSESFGRTRISSKKSAGIYNLAIKKVTCTLNSAWLLIKYLI